MIPRRSSERGLTAQSDAILPLFSEYERRTSPESSHAVGANEKGAAEARPGVARTGLGVNQGSRRECALLVLDSIVPSESVRMRMGAIDRNA
jgi:hypothetical protein